MSRAAVLAGGLVLALLALTAWQEARIAGQAETIARQARHIGEVEAANAGLARSIRQARTDRSRSEAVAASSARRAEVLAVQARGLERRLRESLRHEKTLDLDGPLPADAALALCLRYRAARGLDAPDSAGSSPGYPDPGEDHPVTAFCEPWRRVTLRDCLDWLGLLLDHAGAERIDKAGVRAWADLKNAAAAEESGN